jgi:histidinol-phosphate aminotransferase
LRVGWGYCPLSVVDMVNRIRLPGSVTGPSLAAAAAALADRQHVSHFRDINRRMREHFISAARGLGLDPVPSHGNFVLVRFPGGTDQADEVYRFMKDEGVMLRPMKGYGLGDCLRVTIGPEADLDIALDKLGKAVNLP